MKKLLFLMLVLSISYVSSQEQYLDIVTLKNGSTILGKITEFNQNENLSIQTKDGYSFLFRVSDVEGVRQEPKRTTPNSFNNGLIGFNQIPQQNFGQQQLRQQQFSTPPRNTQGIALNTPNTQNLFGGTQYTAPQQFANPTPNTALSSRNFQNSGASQGFNQLGNQANVSGFNQNTFPATNGTANQYPSNSYAPESRPNINGFANSTVPYNQLGQGTGQQITPNYNFFPQGQGRSSFSTAPAVNPNFNSLSQGQQGQQGQGAPSYATSPNSGLSPNANIFTDVDSYGSNNNNRSSGVDCNQGFGNYTFVNTTTSFVIVSLQRRLKDGYFGGFKEITIRPNSKGHFSNLKTGDYPFLVKIKNNVNSNQNDYVILGRGNARVETCKNQQIRIE